MKNVKYCEEHTYMLSPEAEISEKSLEFSNNFAGEKSQKNNYNNQ